MNSRSVKDDLADVGPTVEWAGQFVDAAGLSSDLRFAVDLSLEEALANLIMHGRSNGEDKGIVVSVAASGEGAVITVHDRCAPFDLTKQSSDTEGEVLKVGGQGLKLLRSFANEISYATGDGRNTLVMRFAAA